MSKILPRSRRCRASVAFSISAGSRVYVLGVDGELLGGDFRRHAGSPGRTPHAGAEPPALAGRPHCHRRAAGERHRGQRAAPEQRATGHYADEQIDAVEDNVNTNIKRITKHEDFAPGTFVTRSTKSSRVRRRETLGLSYVEDHSSDGSGADPDEEQARQDQAAKANAAGLDAALARKLQMRLKAAMYGVDPLTFFQRFDRDHGGTIDTEELRLLIRATLKIPPLEISDAEINSWGAGRRRVGGPGHRGTRGLRGPRCRHLLRGYPRRRSGKEALREAFSRHGHLDEPRVAYQARGDAAARGCQQRAAPRPAVLHRSPAGAHGG